MSSRRGNAHLVTDALAPLDHLGDGILVHAAARLADGIDNGKV